MDEQSILLALRMQIEDLENLPLPTRNRSSEIQISEITALTAFRAELDGLQQHFLDTQLARTLGRVDQIQSTRRTSVRVGNALSGARNAVPRRSSSSNQVPLITRRPTAERMNETVNAFAGGPTPLNERIEHGVSREIEHSPEINAVSTLRATGECEEKATSLDGHHQSPSQGCVSIVLSDPATVEAEGSRTVHTLVSSKEESESAESLSPAPYSTVATGAQALEPQLQLLHSVKDSSKQPISPMDLFGLLSGLLSSPSPTTSPTAAPNSGSASADLQESIGIQASPNSVPVISESTGTQSTMTPAHPKHTIPKPTVITDRRSACREVDPMSISASTQAKCVPSLHHLTEPTESMVSSARSQLVAMLGSSFLWLLLTKTDLLKSPASPRNSPEQVAEFSESPEPSTASSTKLTSQCPNASISEHVEKHNCVACDDEMACDASLHTSCGHHFCQHCAVLLFEKALIDESLFPPHCCKPLEAAPEILGPELCERFKAKLIELSTEDRTYCADPLCARFILPKHIDKTTATCTCKHQTCTVCKGAAHPNNECLGDPQTRKVLDLGKEKGWKQCAQCHHMIEINMGCNHMQ